MDKRTFVKANKIFHEKVFESIGESSVEGLGEEFMTSLDGCLPDVSDVLMRVYYKEYGIGVERIEKNDYVRAPKRIKAAFYEMMKDTEVLLPKHIPDSYPFEDFMAVCEYIYDQYGGEHNETQEGLYSSGFYTHVLEKYEKIFDNSPTKEVLKEIQLTLQNKLNAAKVELFHEGLDVLNYETLLSTIILFELSALIQENKEVTRTKKQLEQISALFSYFLTAGTLDERILEEIKKINEEVSVKQKSFGALLEELKVDYEKRMGKDAPSDAYLYRDTGIDGSHFNAAKKGKRAASALMLFAVCIGLEVTEEQAFKIFSECKDTKDLASYNVCNAVLCYCIRNQKWDINFFLNNILYYFQKGAEIEIDLPRYMSSEDMMLRLESIKEEIQ